MQETSYRKLSATLLADFESCLRSRNCGDIGRRVRVVRTFLDSFSNADLLTNAEPTIRAFGHLMASRRLSQGTITYRTAVLREFFEHLESSGTRRSQWLAVS
jgi:site-specific recombinase XerD